MQYFKTEGKGKYQNEENISQSMYKIINTYTKNILNPQDLNS